MTISSIPAVKYHGSGTTVEAAREQAASEALSHSLDHSTTMKSFEETQGKINRVAMFREIQGKADSFHGQGIVHQVKKILSTIKSVNS